MTWAVHTLRERERAEEALNLLLKEGASQPKNKDLQREIIALGLESGREEDVLRIYSQLIAREPQRLAWRTGLALLHLLRGRRAEAEAAFASGLEAAEAGNQQLQVARAAGDMGLRDFARRAAEAVRAAGDPKAAPLAELYLAELAFEEGDTEGSLETLKRVETLVGEDAELLARIADVHEAEDESERRDLAHGGVRRE